MLPVEFTIEGPPVSHQTSNPERLQEWKELIRVAAQNSLEDEHEPVDGEVEIVVVYYHDGRAVKIDNDNLIKPIQDALTGIVYVDDNQLTDTKIRKTRLDGSFKVKGMSSVLADAFVEGNEFLHVRVAHAPDHAELL